MSIAAYRSLLRLDFPTSFGLLDKMGTYADLIAHKTKEAGFKASSIEVDSVQRVIKAKVNGDGDSHLLQVQPNLVIADVQHSKGNEIDSLAKHASFLLADSIVSALFDDGLSVINRIGFRVWLLDDRGKGSFNAVRDWFVDKNNDVSSSLAKVFSGTNDIAVVLEAKNDASLDCRVIMGPYQSSERKKYFAFDPPVEEGLVLDVDMYHNNIELPKPSVSKTILNFQTQINLIADELSNITRGASSS